MRRLHIVVLASIVALWLAGCGGKTPPIPPGGGDGGHAVCPPVAAAPVCPKP